MRLLVNDIQLVKLSSTVGTSIFPRRANENDWTGELYSQILCPLDLTEVGTFEEQSVQRLFSGEG
jgi:hypothetical protein